MDDDQESIGPDSEYRYWAFISYSNKDKPWARWLERAIESYGIPTRLVDHPTPIGDPAPKRFKPLFRDRSELSAAADLGTQIEAALRASRYLIVVCSPHAAQSTWVNREIETFQALGRPGRVLTLIVEGEPSAGDERECFPVALRDTEPLAADARPQGDGRRDARLKLLAGMLGVGFDALKQRDTHRRLRRLQAMIAAVLTLAMGFAAIAVVAELQREKAVKARTQAEGILEVLLYDVRDYLRPIGRLDIVEAVQKKVDEYYKEMGTEADISVTLLNRTTALNNKGERLMTQGRVGEALRQFQAGLKIMQRLHDAQPDKILWQRNLAIGHEFVGTALSEQDAWTAAQLQYEAALEISLDVAASDRRNPDYQRELAAAHSNVGDALMAQLKLPEAWGHYAAALDITQRLLQSDKNNSLLQDGLVVIHANMGKMLYLQQKWAEALEHYRAALNIDKSRVASDRLNTRWQQNLAQDHDDIADVLVGQGNLDDALRHYRAALKTRRQLVAWDPSNADWQGDLSEDIRKVASALEAQGYALMAQGKLSAALQKHSAALKIVGSGLSSDPGNAELTALLTELRDFEKVLQKAQKHS